MVWTIEYYSEVVESFIIDELPKGLQARYFHLTDRMEIYGPNLKEPHTKALGNGLFELRLKGSEGIARILYCTVINRKIVMLHGFIKKTDKIHSTNLDIARKRMKEVMKNNADT